MLGGLLFLQEVRLEEGGANVFSGEDAIGPVFLFWFDGRKANGTGHQVGKLKS